LKTIVSTVTNQSTDRINRQKVDDDDDDDDERDSIHG